MTPKQARIELARRHLLDFTQYTFPDYEANWHHEVIADHLEALVRLEINKLIIVTPPRRGKSELVSRRLPAWIYGRKPDAKIIAASHSGSLAEAMSRDVQRIMESRKYEQVFGTRFNDETRQTYDEFETNGGGRYRAVGVGKRIAGFGGRIGIIDDYFGLRKDAESPSKRDTVWEWYTDDFSTRLKHPSAQIVMATRWHHDDLIGRILNSGDAQNWTVIHLPEILDHDDPAPHDPREYGEALWPGYFKNGPDDPADHAELNQRAVDEFNRRMARNAYGTEALYQGRPSPRQGGLFSREWFSHYQSKPERIAASCDEILISVDATFKRTASSDFVAALVIGRKGNQYFVLDERFDRMDYPETKRMLAALQAKWPRASILIEDKANGPALIAELNTKLNRVIPFDPGDDSKQSRAQMAANAFEAGQIHLPLGTHAPWISDWMEDLAGYPSRPHDDRVDALSQAIIRWSTSTKGYDHLRRVLGV